MDDDLTHRLQDFPDDPNEMDWQREGLLFYYYMIAQEKKYDEKIQKILEKFKQTFQSSSNASSEERAKIYNELKYELYKLKKKDNSFERSLAYILLISKTVEAMRESLEMILNEKSVLRSIESVTPLKTFDKEMVDLVEEESESIQKTINSITRIVRTESWRFVNEERLQEFRDKGYKYKTTYPVKDDRTGEDSWYYYDQQQVKPIDEPFNYTWEGKERIFMTPPDRPNDRNILIPYVDTPEENESLG